VTLVAQHSPEPTASEFGVVAREIGLGVHLADAIGRLATRTANPDYALVAIIIRVQHEVGGNLSRILDGIANTIRERLRIRGEIRAITGQQRLSAYIVSALPVFIAVVLRFIAPTYFAKLLEPGAMRILIVMGVLLLVAGFYVLRRIADIEV
jgi:tight adherence protein B